MFHIKKINIIFSVLTLCIILTGCSSLKNNSENNTKQIQKAFSKIGNFQTDIKFLCDSGESILEYDCKVEYNKEYGQTLTIEEPSSLSGITIHSTGDTKDNINISYQDTVLDFDPSCTIGTSPADCMPALISELKNNIPTDTWEETQNSQKLLVARYESNDSDKDNIYQIWFYKDTLYPMYTEIYTDGKRVLQIFFNNFKAS